MFTIQEEDGFLVSGCFLLFCDPNLNFFIMVYLLALQGFSNPSNHKKKSTVKGKPYYPLRNNSQKDSRVPRSFSINDSAMLDAYATAVGLRCAFDTATRDSHDVTGTLIVFDAATCLGLFCQVFFAGQMAPNMNEMTEAKHLDSLWSFCFLGQRFCHTGRMDVMKYSGFRTLSLSLYMYKLSKIIISSLMHLIICILYTSIPIFFDTTYHAVMKWKKNWSRH